MGLGKGHRGSSRGAWGNEKTESSMLYGFIIWFGVGQGTETTEERRKEARLLWARLRGSDGTDLLHGGQRSQWGSWQHKPQGVLVSVFIRVLYKRFLHYLSADKALWEGRLKWSLNPWIPVLSYESWTLSWIGMKGSAAYSSFSHWNALELWNFLYMGPLRTKQAIIHQDGRAAPAPRQKVTLKDSGLTCCFSAFNHRDFWLYHWGQIKCCSTTSSPQAPLQLFLVYFSGITIWFDVMKWFSLFPNAKFSPVYFWCLETKYLCHHVFPESDF